MFSPAAKKPHFLAQRDRPSGYALPETPITPVSDNRKLSSGGIVPPRPSTGTPVPWSSRLSVLARIASAKKAEKGSDADQIQPVYIGEFPQEVRIAQASLLQKGISGDSGLSGGIDRETSLSWILCGNRLFVWSYLSPAVSQKCVHLELPHVIENGNVGTKSMQGNSWMACVIEWDNPCFTSGKLIREGNSVGVVLCNQKTQAVVYWPDIYSESGTSAVFSIPPVDGTEKTSYVDGKSMTNRHLNRNWTGNSHVTEPCAFNSFIASPVPGSTSHECIALACCSNGELWHFSCTPSEIFRKKISPESGSGSFQGSDNGTPTLIQKGYARSLTWRYQISPQKESTREFFVLTDREIQCWNIELTPDINVSILWSHEIVGTDSDLGIKKDLAGQKQIWLLDMQVDGKEFTVLVATLCKDRVSGSSYTQYSLLTMQYRPSQNTSLESFGSNHQKVLEKKAPIQVILPKARVEEEDFLFSMRLRVGGKPLGSAMILSGEGTATVTHYWRGSTRLYQFDLPWDAGKVLDASVVPSMEDGEEGVWVVLTEKAGVWAIPEKAVLVGGVEPPERSLSRKGSSNEGAAEEEKRSLAFGGSVAPRRAISDAWEVGDRQRAILTGIAHRTAQDEESEALIRALFHDFLLSGQVGNSFEKLRSSGAFEKDGETNVFARTSKFIIDTLAKHWTTTRGAEIVAMSVVSCQLLDKQQKHQQFLQFLALSKCHEELRFKQRYSLHIILEHGEKLAGMIHLKDLQDKLSQNRSNGGDSPYSNAPNETSGSLWDLIQLVGEKARRNTVLLMDRDNAEVFYSKVSDLEQVFYCVSHHLPHIVGADLQFLTQKHRVCEISNACTTLICAAISYRKTHSTWYPSLEGLTPWYCQPAVRCGLWSIGSFILQLLKDASGFDMAVASDLFSHLKELTDGLLEAYAGAITSKMEREEDCKGLQMEYWTRRDVLLDVLYNLVKDLAEARYQESNKGSEIPGLREAILRELCGPLISISRFHAGYQTLWNICCDLSDTGFLQSLMHESMSPNGGSFTFFVFKKCYENHQYARLLRFGEEFQEELASFLLQHKEMLWLHEIFLNHFSSASETLHSLALSEYNDTESLTDEDSDSVKTKWDLSLVDRRRLLNLSKIAAAAGGDPGFETKIGRIDADLQMLKLQEDVARQCECENRLFPPRELIEICLKSKDRELILRTFDIFAWTSSLFRRSNKSLLEECWMSAANSDSWSRLYQASTVEGWSDNETVQNLRETLVFQASNRCYGPEAQVYEGRFQEVLPLLQEEVELSSFPMTKDLGSSLEGILMKHPDFPEAGKLMLMAIMMGKDGINIEAEEDSPMM